MRRRRGDVFRVTADEQIVWMKRDIFFLEFFLLRAPKTKLGEKKEQEVGY